MKKMKIIFAKKIKFFFGFRKPNLQDLKMLSPTTAKYDFYFIKFSIELLSFLFNLRSLESILEYDNDDLESVFCLNFDITRQRFDQTVVVELKPDGSNIPVTKQNKKEYVDLYVDFIFNKCVEKPFEAFSKGFHHVCGSKVLVKKFFEVF